MRPLTNYFLGLAPDVCLFESKTTYLSEVRAEQLRGALRMASTILSNEEGDGASPQTHPPTQAFPLVK